MSNQNTRKSKMEKRVLQPLLIFAIASVALVSGTSPVYALYVADLQTVTTTKNTPITFNLTGSAPVDFFYRVLTHPDVADICTEGYVSNPPTCEHGYMEYNGETGQVWYTPNEDFVGTDSFTFETVAQMGPWSGDVVGVVTIVIEENSSDTTTTYTDELSITQEAHNTSAEETLEYVPSSSSNIVSWTIISNSLGHYAMSLVALSQSVLDFFTNTENS